MTPDQVANTLLTALRSIAGLTVYDGHVPDTVPKDGAGYVRPYVTLYLGAPTGLSWETAVCGTYDTHSQTHQFQTTLVGATAQHVRAVSGFVVPTLTNLRVGQGRVRPVWEQHASTVPLPDTAVSPVRYFLPLQWALTTQ